jgi:hypothetical protein
MADTEQSDGQTNSKEKVVTTKEVAEEDVLVVDLNDADVVLSGRETAIRSSKSRVSGGSKIVGSPKIL